MRLWSVIYERAPVDLDQWEAHCEHQCEKISIEKASSRAFFVLSGFHYSIVYNRNSLGTIADEHWVNVVCLHATRYGVNVRECGMKVKLGQYIEENRYQ